jgi:hypothetical protein
MLDVFFALLSFVSYEYETGFIVAARAAEVVGSSLAPDFLGGGPERGVGGVGVVGADYAGGVYAGAVGGGEG